MHPQTFWSTARVHARAHLGVHVCACAHVTHLGALTTLVVLAEYLKWIHLPCLDCIQVVLPPTAHQYLQSAARLGMHKQKKYRKTQLMLHSQVGWMEA